MAHVISKSRFIAGWQCEKRLWFEFNKPELKVLDDESRFAMQQGTAIGRLAQGLFPEGVEIKAGFQERSQAVQETRQAAAAGASALFEAAAEAGGAFARADLIVKRGETWDLLEVKTSGYREEAELARNKEQFLWDLALQRWVFEKAGWAIGKASLVLVNKQYVRQGDIEPEKFFQTEEAASEVNLRARRVPEMLDRFAKAADLASPPGVKIGLQCSQPYACPFVDQCWDKVPEYSVFDLRMMKKENAFALFHSGVQGIDAVPRDMKLTDFQRLQLKARAEGQRIVDKQAIQAFLDSLQYPLTFLDFETINPALPPFDGLSPFRHTVFQYSIHVQDQPGAPPVHFEYLPSHENDPRPELVDGMLKALGTKGTVLAYNASFEKGRLQDLALAFLKQAPALLAVRERVADLMTPFAKGHFYDPAFKGSVSMKKVLPALVPGMGYDSLEIGEGAAASRAYLEILDPQTTFARRGELRPALKTYCGQDTLAMVKVLGVLESSV